MTFEGQTVLVTGAASGIGRATALAFAAQGAQVILADIGDTEAVSADIALAGGHATAIPCDVADPASVDAMFGAIDTLHIAAHCAGILVGGGISTMSATDFDRQIAVNLRGPFLIAQGAVRAMQRRELDPGVGRIILVASELAHQGRAGAAAYCASKAGVIGLSRALARECAPDILVNAVAPGPIDTPMLDAANMAPEKLAMETANPLGRIGQPEDIAAAMLYLAGPGGAYMTGQTLCPSGGAVML